MENFKKFVNFTQKYKLVISSVVLGLFAFLLLFLNLGNYPLIDVDETRYVGISFEMLKNGDWITPILNGVPFLEKPPLYFWITAFFIKFFGIMTEFTARFGNALLAFLGIFYTFFFSRKVLNTSFAIINSFILMSSLWVLIFSHITILDMGFMVMTMSAIYSAILTMFCKEEKNKKYCWWVAYLFMGLSVLMKGLIGIIIPAMVVGLTFICMRKFKELFKPVYIFPGLLIFCLVALPWHILVYQANGDFWVQDYIIKHHLARFMDSGMGLGRKQPFWFYIPVIFAGLLPWTFSFLASVASGLKITIKDIKIAKTLKTIFSVDTKDKKVLLFASVYFLSVFLFFSASSTKLPTYILTLFPAISLICAYYWWGYLEYDKNKRGIKIATVSNAILFIVAGIVGLVGVCFFPQIQKEIQGIESFLYEAIILCLVMGIQMLILLNKNLKGFLFITHIILMTGVVYIATTHIFTFITQFGQNELQKYSVIAKTTPNSELVTFDFPAKYSVWNEFEDEVVFIKEKGFDELNNVTGDNKQTQETTFVIVKNKNYEKYKEKFKKYQTIEIGKKYTLLRIK